MELTKTAITQFQNQVWDYYHVHGRHDLPWRQPEKDGSFDPYKILVSEIMLQQTQVNRVIPKYHEFLTQFPTIQALAKAELKQVLITWSGLGYNRRAKYLYEAAKQIAKQDQFPDINTELVKFPGIGKNTAGAIVAYAFNRPALFIETNIRTVYIHHFLSSRTNITDVEILELLSQTIAMENPREFYWALMDYGAHTKTTIKVNKLSKHYTKQSSFHGSLRQLRGQVLRALAIDSLSYQELSIQIPDERLGAVADTLVKEGLIQKSGNSFSL